MTNEVGRVGKKMKRFYKVSSQIKISFEFQETQVTCPSFDSPVARQRSLSNYLLITVFLWKLFSFQEITRQK